MVISLIILIMSTIIVFLVLTTLVLLSFVLKYKKSKMYTGMFKHTVELNNNKLSKAMIFPIVVSLSWFLLFFLTN